MKTKLIHTNLLSKHKHNSLLALATATHLEYCNYQYKRVMSENNYFYTLRNVLDELLYLVIFPIYALTHGFILYPVYICSHISKQKKIIQRYDNDINCINEMAEKAQIKADEHLKSATYNEDCFTIERTGNKK